MNVNESGRCLKRSFETEETPSKRRRLDGDGAGAGAGSVGTIAHEALQQSISDPMDSSSIGARELDRDSAATEIQRVWRGYIVRKKLDVKVLLPFANLVHDYAKYVQYVLEGMQQHVDALWHKGVLDVGQRRNQIEAIQSVVEKHSSFVNFYDDFMENPAVLDTMDIVLEGKEKIEELDGDLKDLAIRVGARNIQEVLNLFFSSGWMEILNEGGMKRVMDLTDVFHPVSYKIVDALYQEDISGNYTKFSDDEGEFVHDYTGEYEQGYPIVMKDAYLGSDTAMDTLRGAEVFIPLQDGNKALVIKGYFDPDETGVIGKREWFAEKHEQLRQHLTYVDGVPAGFKQNFFQQYSLRDFLVMNEEELEEDLQEAYEELQEISGMLTKPSIKKFLSSDLEEQVRMLSVLLSSDEKILGFWFMDLVGKAQPRYQEILYQNLHFTHQKTLREIGQKIAEMRAELEEKGPENFTLEQRIEMSEMPLEIKRRCLSMIQSDGASAGPFGMLSGGDKEEKEWVEKLLEYPWGKTIPLPVGPENTRVERAAWLAEFQENLDQAVVGLQKAKDQIIGLAARLAKTGKGGVVVALVGPPGTAKTTFARDGIAKAFGLPFVQLEGKDDLVNLIGTATNYKSAKPGRLFSMFKEAKSKRFVVLIDEFDKFGDTVKAQQCLEKFIQILDSKQNHALAIDNYFDGVEFDFSNVIFVVTGNDRRRFGSILSDRLTIVEIGALEEDNKVKVARKFTIPRLLSKNGFEEGDIVFSDEILRKLIQDYTFEAGARKFEEKLSIIFEALTTREQKSAENPLPYTVDEAMVEEILGDPMRPEKKVPEEPRVGWVNGLYATTAGIGGTESVEVQKMYGKRFGHIEITGTVGGMIVESSKVAYAVALQLIPSEKRQEILSGEKFGLLIHHGNIGSKVDGPSSGAAIVTSMVSQLTGIPVREKLCMTGEIGPLGLVKAIGGLRSKLTGAKRQGCTMALVPKENERDFEKILREVPDLIEPGKFEVKIVERIEEVLEHALVDNDIF